ncbi:MAG: hypothetical protein RMN25_08240, partial [Anaerolineae bacterium]|nr:hypothetical protein [Thermoflexales bacterium]MDW8407762.1 hypothetical protein [Anaerolineae bacterium]
EEMFGNEVQFELINIDLPESAEAKQKYRFIGQPQFVIVNPDGEVVVSRNGFQTFERLRDDLNEALEKR